MRRLIGGEARKYVVPEVVFGLGARRLAGQYARNLGGRRVLVVTDRGLVEAGWTDEVVESLGEAGLEAEVFAEVTPNPKDREVAAGAQVFRAASCNLLVAVGGGSPMDCAKGIGIVASNGGQIARYEGVDRVERPSAPMVFVPTTAGTAADVSQFCIVTDTERRTKMSIVSRALVPDVSLVDPEVTTTMDPALTANTGMDAFCHAVEALASNAGSPLTDLHAIEAVRRVLESLEAAVRAPRDLAARAGMAFASLQAGLAFSNASLGAVHAMAHALGGMKDLPHGECNAILLPHVVRYNFEAAREAHDRLAGAMGLDLGGLAPDAAREALVEAVAGLARRVGVEATLRHHEVTRADLPALASRALADACIVTNPRVPKPGEIEALYEQAL